jgi:cyanophycinase-like exopeptidase
LFTRGTIPTHFDMVESFFPGLRQLIFDAQPADTVLFGIDEDTAACGDGTEWTVLGKRAVTILPAEGDEPVEHFSGASVTCDLGLSLGAHF